MSRQSDDLVRVSALYRAHGTVPSWERVWLDGVDDARSAKHLAVAVAVCVSGGRAERLRPDYLRWHDEAAAEHEVLNAAVRRRDSS